MFDVSGRASKILLSIIVLDDSRPMIMMTQGSPGYAALDEYLRSIPDSIRWIALPASYGGH